MRKINILYVITKLELGGAQRQLLAIIRNIDREKYNPFLFTTKEGILVQEAASIQGLNIIYCNYLTRPLNPIFDFLAFLQIYRFLKRSPIDIVHTHSSKAGILGRWAAYLAKVKIIVHTVHGWSFYFFQATPLRRIFILLERVTAIVTDCIVVVSQHDKDVGLKNKIGHYSKYQLVRYGINRKDFDVHQNSSIREKIGLSPKDLVVGMVACLKPQKAPEDFVEVARLVHQNLSEVKFLLVGDGKLRKKVEKLIRRYNLSDTIKLLGWRKDVPLLLAAMDICVLTSLWEGLPIFVLEALASGKPVVATDTGGIKEVVVDGKTGYILKPHDVAGIAEKIILLLRDLSLRGEISRSCKFALDESYEFNFMLGATFGLYQSLLRVKGFYA